MINEKSCGRKKETERMGVQLNKTKRRERKEEKRKNEREGDRMSGKYSQLFHFYCLFDGKLRMGHRAMNVFIAPNIINRFLTLL